jgi:hypothetical protein
MQAASPFETERVRRHTSPALNAQIDERILHTLRLYSGKPRDLITARLNELDDEWDVERVLETNASTLALTGVALSIAVNRKWLLLTAGVLGFLFQHGTQGWCPPLPVLRRLGIRTRDEINRERFALKYLRGDFSDLNDGEPDPLRLAQLLAK